LWEVYDTGSGAVVKIDGLPLAGFDEKEADEAVERLQARDIYRPNKSPGTP